MSRRSPAGLALQELHDLFASARCQYQLLINRKSCAATQSGRTALCYGSTYRKPPSLHADSGYHRLPAQLICPALAAVYRGQAQWYCSASGFALVAQYSEAASTVRRLRLPATTAQHSGVGPSSAPPAGLPSVPRRHHGRQRNKGFEPLKPGPGPALYVIFCREYSRLLLP